MLRVLGSFTMPISLRAKSRYTSRRQEAVWHASDVLHVRGRHMEGATSFWVTTWVFASRSRKGLAPTGFCANIVGLPRCASCLVHDATSGRYQVSGTPPTMLCTAGSLTPVRSRHSAAERSRSRRRIRTLSRQATGVLPGEVIQSLSLQPPPPSLMLSFEECLA